MSLQYNFIEARQGQQNIVIMLHGYGSSMDDLTSLSLMFNNLPNTSFVIPNAPNHCDQGIGFQWFPLYVDHNDEITFEISEIKESQDILEEFINKIALEHKCLHNKITLFGFSQGGILSLNYGLYGSKALNGLICHSGLLAIDDYQTINNLEKNIFIVHGKADDVVKYGFIEETMLFLNKSNISYKSFIKDSLAHSVDEETIAKVEQFIIDSLLPKE